MLVLYLLLGPVRSGGTAEPNPEQASAIAEIRKLGGQVTVDENEPRQPVISVDCEDTELSDTGLVHICEFAELQTLNLSGTEVTDAGLVHLKKLTKLKTLDLWATHLTDAGLVHLRGLTRIQTLNLAETVITDAGLEHLQGLTSL